MHRGLYHYADADGPAVNFIGSKIISDAGTR